ncbi:MAG: hypothetical protein FWE19_02075 [Oscillospiraceae bacterium]|nr:hypothetical protein [Oscillospiraceae bacterium]
MFDIKKHRLSKQDAIIIIDCIILIIVLLIVSPHLPDTRAGAIRRELARQRHDVEHVDFEFVRNREGARGWIFQSSVPLYFDGRYVSQWSVVSYSMGVGLRHIRYFVEPYPLPAVSKNPLDACPRG